MIIQFKEKNAMEQLTAERVKEFAKDWGADIVGIAPIDRFEGAPMERDPKFIMPRAKSIIGLGFRIHRGIFRGVEEQTFYSGYSLMGFAHINDYFAPLTLRRLCNLFEDHGYEALPYHDRSTHFSRNSGRAASPDKPAPDVFLNFRIAAVLCGMGEIGYSNMFLSPEFGPAQRLAFVITEAELEPDPLFQGRLCDRCRACERACPAAAIEHEGAEDLNLQGRPPVLRAKIDTYKCGAISNVGTRETSPFITEEVAEVVEKIKKGEKPEFEKIWQLFSDQMPFVRVASNNYNHAAALCVGAGCYRACLDHLEKKGSLTHKFSHNFRET
jgi:ferredoxin